MSFYRNSCGKASSVRYRGDTIKWQIRSNSTLECLILGSSKAFSVFYGGLSFAWIRCGFREYTRTVWRAALDSKSLSALNAPVEAFAGLFSSVNSEMGREWGRVSR